MSRDAAARAVRLIATVILTALAFCVWPVVIGERSVVERAAAWVGSHAENLPSTLDEINLYPAAYQDAIFLALTPPARMKLWQEYLVGAAENEVALSSVQRRFLRQLANTISEDEFTPGAEYTEKTLALLAEVEKVLGPRSDLVSRNAWMRPLGRRFFPQVGLIRTLTAFRVRAGEDLMARIVASAQTLPDCTCFAEAKGTYDCPYRQNYIKGCEKTPSTSAL